MGLLKPVNRKADIIRIKRINYNSTNELHSIKFAFEISVKKTVSKLTNICVNITTSVLVSKGKKRFQYQKKVGSDFQ